jgi:DNA modification methylase
LTGLLSARDSSYNFIMRVEKSASPVLNLSIVYRPTDSIKPDPRNARTHSKKQVAEIAASIRQFGFANPLLIDVDGVLIAGHGRLLAAKSIGLHSAPTIMLPHLNEAQRRALRLADNKIALNAVWDQDLRKLELKELADLEIDFDLSVTGFSTGEIDVLLASKGDPDDETIPAVPIQPRTRQGDIWICGHHRVGCGDGRDVDFLREVIGKDAAIDAAFLDPPYNVRINGHANARGRHREFAMASGEMTDEAFRVFLSETLGACARVSRDGAVHFVCMDWRHMEDVAAVGKRSLYRSKHELIFVYRVGAAPHFNAVELGKHGRNRTNVWDYASVNSFVGARREDLILHPTVKPTALVADALQDVTKRGDLVLDIFLGSGTTLIAAERSGRRFRGVDIDPAYVDVAIERWETITGQAAEKASSDGQ